MASSSSGALGGYKSASWSVLLGNFRPYSSEWQSFTIGTVFSSTIVTG